MDIYIILGAESTEGQKTVDMTSLLLFAVSPYSIAVKVGSK